MALNIFEPLKFSTQGINDLATKTSLIVSDGKITVDIVEPTKAVTFTGGSFADVEGKGIKWTDGRKNKTLAFKKSTLWTDLSVNLAEEQGYQINDTTVLSFAELGPTVTKSNLKQVGTLKNLIVSGNSSFGEFLYVSSDLNKIGINTESPTAAVSIRENGVDIVVGSNKADKASVGTVSNDHLELITDNTARVTISNSGDVTVHGTLYVEEVIAQRSSPLAFRETATDSIYGKGIIWTSPRGANQLVYQAQPNRIWSTDIIDLADGKYFSIGRISVLSTDTLGDTVTESNLQKLGLLRELQVAGDAAVTRTLSTSKISIGNFSVTDHTLAGYADIKVVRNETNELTIGNNIVLGNADNYSRTISMYGQVAVGVANPDAGVALTVAGSVSFENKKFKVGNGIPTQGTYSKGDIVWNDDPKATDYIGWVCVTPGAPGRWLPFGAIASV